MAPESEKTAEITVTRRTPACLPACVWKIAPFILDQTLSSWYERLRREMPEISLRWIPDLLPHFNVAAPCCDLGWSELTRGEQSGSKASAHALWKQVEYKNSNAVNSVNTSTPIITCPVIKLYTLTTIKKKSISYITIYTVSYISFFLFLNFSFYERDVILFLNMCCF